MISKCANKSKQKKENIFIVSQTKNKVVTKNNSNKNANDNNENSPPTFGSQLTKP